MAIYPDERASWYLETARVVDGTFKYGELRLLGLIKECPELTEVCGVPVERTQRIYYPFERTTFRIYFVNEREVARFDGDPFFRRNGRIRTPEWFKWRVDRALDKDVLPFYVFHHEHDKDIARTIAKNMRDDQIEPPGADVLDLIRRVGRILVKELQEYTTIADCPLVLRAAWPQPIMLVDHDNGADVRRDAVACEPLRFGADIDVVDAEAIAGAFLGILKFQLMTKARLPHKRTPLGQVLVLCTGPTPGTRIYDPTTLAILPRPWFMRAGVLNVEPPSEQIS